MSDDETEQDKHSIGNKYDLLFAIIRDIGFPSVVCAALLAGLYVFGDRTTKGYVETLSVVQDSLIKQSAAMERFAESLDESRQMADERTRLLNMIYDEQHKTLKAIEQIEQKLGM